MYLIRPFPIVILFLLSLSIPLTAQDSFLKDYAPVAPTPASLGKYGDIPVGYHTGVPDIPSRFTPLSKARSLCR